MKPEFLPKTPEDRLWRLAEECTEVAEICHRIAYTTCRAGRFGMERAQHGSWSGLSPKARLRDAFASLREELADLEHAIAAVESDLEEKDAAA